MKKFLLALSLLALAGAAQAQINIGGTQANSAAHAGAAAGVNFAPEASVIPTDTKQRIENAPAMGGLMGWAYGAGSGNCIGPSESTAASAQLSVVGTGAGLGAGRGTTNLDWGCVLRREMEVADARCKGGLKKACDDLDRLYEMQPGITAIRASALPDYAQGQVVPKPQPAKTASAAPVVVASSNPTCTTDEFIARRTGQAVCK
jgi:hypothetical protein